MPRIRILPEIISNKIAAGEVVERPASVVKELIENALDADGTRIDIDIKNGGKSLIQVADNGSGMKPDDALLALERYATSKITTDRDLFAIRTLGFRGEALPSIASVARFKMITRDAASPIGTQINVTGGRIDSVTETGAPVGTLISVKQLFFNTPARRKFLKTVNTEFGHIADTTAAMAMGHPNVRFTLRHNERPIKNWPAVSDGVDRVSDILGSKVKPGLCPVQMQNENIQLSGWIARPDIYRKSFRGIHLYVNSRAVRDRVLRHALLSAYSGRLMKGRYPLAVLFIEIPPEEVDVNVHPTKHEVRFVRQQAVHHIVATAVSGALKHLERPLWQPQQSKPQHRVSESTITYEPAQPPVISSRPPPPESMQKRNSAAAPIGQSIQSEDNENGSISITELSSPPLLKEESRHRIRMIGQFHGTYILCDSAEGLIIIDQHAAHERIMFEQFKKRHATGKGPVQQLLIPETIEVNFTEADQLDRLLPDLARAGLDIEPFGRNTFVIKAMPALLGCGEIAPLVRDILDKVLSTGQKPHPSQLIDECLILMACHGALRANQRLDETEQEALVNQLMACDNPAHCPHGRPTWVRWSVEDLEKSFGRRL